VGIPVIGSGGIVSGRDALEFIAVGAHAIQIGTASFVRPRAALDALEEMTAWLKARGVRCLEDWRGSLAAGEAVRPARPARRAAPRRAARMR
jgi:dihydroorotate dehydrogenase (NAD+) catalytic subunit